MTLTGFFFWGWVIFTAFFILQFIWGCLRGWELEIMLPLAGIFCGGAAWWIAYLIIDKIAQHITIH